MCVLPPNTTSVLQPMDAGIINSLKCHYKKILVDYYLGGLDEKNCMLQMDYRKAIKFISTAWKQVTEETIANCFTHVGYINQKERHVAYRVEKSAVYSELTEQIKKFI